MHHVFKMHTVTYRCNKADSGIKKGNPMPVHIRAARNDLSLSEILSLADSVLDPDGQIALSPF